jgi:hypothetical protein
MSLAREAEQLYVKKALIEMAEDFTELAEKAQAQRSAAV